MIKNIIFDFGGVILKHKATITPDILSTIFPEAKEQIQKLWTNKYKILLTTGQKTSKDFLLELKNLTNSDLNIDELRKKWKSLYKKEAKNVDYQLLDFISRLKTKYRVYLFTDTMDVHDEYNSTRNIYDKFDAVYKSYREGISKAAGKEAFLYVLNKIGAKPNECIFIDDLEKNIKTSEEVGITGIVYKDVNQLQKQLKSMGID